MSEVSVAHPVSLSSKKRRRVSFGKSKFFLPMPDLIKLQFDSFQSFLQPDLDTREDSGLEKEFKAIFPVTDYYNTASLHYVSYCVGAPKYNIEEAIQRGVNYSAPLKVKLQLVVWDVEEDGPSSSSAASASASSDLSSREVKTIKEQEVFIGEVPLMAEAGTFIINGVERVVVSQMQRSPGVFYDHDGGKTHSSGKYLYKARIVPYRGSWIDIEFDHKDILYFRIDRKRKMHIATLLLALGMDTVEILEYFYDSTECLRVEDKWRVKLDITSYKNRLLSEDIVNADTGEVVFTSGTKVTPRVIRKFRQEYADVHILVPSESLVGKYLMSSIIDDETDEIIADAGDEITEELLSEILDLEIPAIKIIDIDYVNVGSYIRNSLVLDKNLTQDDACTDIYRVLRPGDPSTAQSARELFRSTFFSSARYDLSDIGRMKINIKHGLEVPETCTVLTKEDILIVIKHLIKLKDGVVFDVDDIDNLGNRRVRPVGELIENQFRVALNKMVRAAVEKIGTVDLDTVMPQDLISSRIITSMVREFFGMSQLSQFMDQTNPLAEITHKRRLSTLGPGGLTRDRASFEVRDVHHTHYGRICPIETPEGQNIGLINSLATYGRINHYGFIESPYRIVKEGVVTDEVRYLSAMEEAEKTLAPAGVRLDSAGNFIDEKINCRRDGEVISCFRDEIDYVGVSPKQLVSVASALIPFLENDDANRALMGANMQRQAVPLITAEAPFVGTGVEAIVASDSGATVVARRPGIVRNVDANRIVIQADDLSDSDSGVDIYTLQKMRKSNHNTCINQSPIVSIGERVETGDIIADSSSTQLGELALGKNLRVAFMPWNGYNFEDAILLSERLVSGDVLTSIHIKEFEVVARDTRLGPEEITRDLPNISEDSLSHLDEVGIVHIGASVSYGDILVAKVTPKSESPITPEEKLLRAIFAEKASDVRDTSLKVPPGVKGVVIGVNILTRRGVEKDERAISLERFQIDRMSKDMEDTMQIISEYVIEKISELLVGCVVAGKSKFLTPGDKITAAMLSSLTRGQLFKILVTDGDINAKVAESVEFFNAKRLDLDIELNAKIKKLQSGDDLPQGALKVVKVYVATKLKIQPGDKMAGRHGNKGVISKICPIEDMPFSDDGEPVDVVLNPLGIPQRMNAGQIFETHLGLASSLVGKRVSEAVEKYQEAHNKSELMKCLKEVYHTDPEFLAYLSKCDEKSLLELSDNLSSGVPFATPVFDGASESDIEGLLTSSGFDKSGAMMLRDGRTGEYFDRPVTVGYIYMMKLDHLVEDKIHARATGPYSLVTQQPLGGKSHFGGQRFGEMECWALQAYGAAFTLQEILTVKSDDVTGRVKMYESIVKGDVAFRSGIPESFNVMVKELCSLCLSVDLQSKNDNDN